MKAPEEDSGSASSPGTRLVIFRIGRLHTTKLQQGDWQLRKFIVLASRLLRLDKVSRLHYLLAAP